MMKFNLCLAVLVVLGALAAPALAGSCTYAKRDLNYVGNWNAGGETTVRNDMTSAKLGVEFFRGGGEKKMVWLEPGETTSKLATFPNGGGGAVLRVAFFPDPGTTTTDCSYRIRVKEGGDWVEWELPEDATDVCTQTRDMAITCTKDWNKDKNRYRTHFRVGDPQ